MRALAGGIPVTSNATPIKCLDLDDTNGQLKLEGWLYIALIFYILFDEAAPFYWQFWRGGPILLAFRERRPHFIGYLREEGPFYWVNLGGGWWIFFYLCQKLCWRLAGVSFYVPSSTWRAGRLDQVILLVWPKQININPLYFILWPCQLMHNMSLSLRNCKYWYDWRGL